MKRNFSFNETCSVNYNVPIRTYLSPDFAFLTPNKHTSSSHVTARAYIEESKNCKGKSIIFVPHNHYAMCNNNISVFQHQFKISNSKMNNYKKKFNDVFTIKKSLPLKLNDKFVLINKYKQPIINKQHPKGRNINKHILTKVHSASTILNDCRSNSSNIKLHNKQRKELSPKYYEKEKNKFTLLLFNEHIDINKKKYELGKFINNFSDRYFVDAIYNSHYNNNSNMNEYE
jgi:hypothetical protein